MSLDASPSDNGNDAADDEEMEEEDEIDDDEEDFDDRRIDDYERLNNSRSAGQRGNVSHSAAAAAAHLAQQQENQRRSSAAAIAYSRALRSAGGAGGGSSSVAVTNPLDDPPPLYGQYLSTRVTGNPNVTTSATNESVSWNPASSSSSSSTHKVTPISHYQTLDRTTTDSGVKLNNQLLRNNLLSSSVRDLLSSTLSHDRSQASYAALNRDNGNRAEYESAGTTCLVRTQSGSRFIFPTEMIETTTSSLVDHTSILMRPGITTSRTIGSKINRRPVVGPSSTFNSFQSRIGKSLNVNLNWRCTSMVLLVICITLFLSLIYSLSRTFDCSCSPALMIEDGSADGSSSSSGNSNSNQILSVPGASVSISCPVLCSGRGQYVKGSCTCNEGWKGRECNIRSDQCDSPNCSNHGSCINGRCQCVPGFKGSNCDQDQCPLLCSGRGQYLKGSCVCSSGWKGKECELRKDQCDPVDCNRHGNCVEGDCVCRPGWKGPACDLSTSLCDVSDCNGRGSCRSGMCDCRPGFKGIHCEITDCLDPNCSGHGSCFEGRCICKPGWMGNNCSSVDQRFGKHFPNCSSRGVFDIETERCSCFSGFTGDRCDIDRCNTDCGPHGSCEGSACIAPPDGSAIDARSRPVIRDVCPMESVRMEPAPVIRDSMASIVPSMAAPPRARVTGSVSETRVTTMAVSLSGAASLSADVNQDGRVWTVLMSLKSIAMIILITITVSPSFCPSLSLSLFCSAQAFIFCRSILVSSLFDPFFFGFPRVSYCDISLPNDVSLSVTVLADSFQSVMKGRVLLLPASMIFFFVPSLLLPLLLRLRLSALSDSEMIPFYPSGFATSMTLLSVCVSMCVSA